MREEETELDWCDGCEFADDKKACKLSLFHQLEAGAYEARQAMICIIEQRVDLFACALQKIRDLAQKARPGYPDLYFKYENWLMEMADHYAVLEREQTEKDMIYLSGAYAGPKQAAQMLEEIMNKHRELLNVFSHILYKLSGPNTPEGLQYRRVYSDLLDSMGRLQVGELSMLDDVARHDDQFIWPWVSGNA